MISTIELLYMFKTNQVMNKESLYLQASSSGETELLLEKKKNENLELILLVIIYYWFIHQ